MSALSSAKEPISTEANPAQRSTNGTPEAPAAVDDAAALKAARRAEIALKVAAAREAQALAAAQSPPKHMQPPQKGERFVYVYLPSGQGIGPQERSLPADGGLENDALSKVLRDPSSEIGPNIDITALTVPGPSNAQLAVSLYQSGNANVSTLPINRWAMGLAHCCGLALGTEIRGDAFVSRYADDDDQHWKRVNIKASELMPDADWVKAAAVANKGRSLGGASLSGLLEQAQEQQLRNSTQMSAAQDTVEKFARNFDQKASVNPRSASTASRLAAANNSANGDDNSLGPTVSAKGRAVTISNEGTAAGDATAEAKAGKKNKKKKHVSVRK